MSKTSMYLLRDIPDVSALNCNILIVRSGKSISVRCVASISVRFMVQRYAYASAYFSSHQPWVSDINPIFFMAAKVDRPR